MSDSRKYTLSFMADIVFDVRASTLQEAKVKAGEFRDHCCAVGVCIDPIEPSEADRYSFGDAESLRAYAQDYDGDAFCLMDETD